MTTKLRAAEIKATMTLHGTRFGTIEFEPADILDFAEGIVGFEGEHRFVLVSPGDDSPFRWLQSLSTPHLSFLLADPSAFRPDYDPEIPVAASARIGLGASDPYFLWTTANVPPGAPRSMTLNLAAPIVVNAATGAGKQIVLDGDRYEVRAAAFVSPSVAQSNDPTDTAEPQRNALRAA